MDTVSPTSPWKGVCYDDGTGRNVYYIDQKGAKFRKMPDNYVPEMFPVNENDEEDNHPVFGCLNMRRYYFRNACIRCRQPTFNIFIARSKFEKAFALNYCAKCIITVTPGINRISGNGDTIWRQNIDIPKNFLKNIKNSVLNPSRDKKLIRRSKEAQLHVKTQAKLYRNAARYLIVKRKAADYNVMSGEHLSWGFGEIFDEYFGEVDKKGLPSGRGVKFYSDGSIYVGDWLEGFQHSTKKSMWTRPDGLQYEGQWMKGQKHGLGTQTYPDGSIYTGEFAKGYEHGMGKRVYRDGSSFEGRHRFGKRDGPGVLTTAEGEVIKKNFKENDVYHEKPIIEVDELTDTVGMNFLEPSSLVTLGIRALAAAMHRRRQLLPSSLIFSRLPGYFKPLVAREFMAQMTPPAKSNFAEIAENIAFIETESIVFEGIKFTYFDVEVLMYFIAANASLKKLKLLSNKLDFAGLELVNKQLEMKSWPHIEVLDISFNYIEIPGLRSLVAALLKTPSLTKLKLSGCKIYATGAEILAEYISSPVQRLLSLDLSFNAVQTEGAEVLAEAIKVNKTLQELNLRQNQIGPVGGEYIVNAMEFNHSLHVLCLADNKIGPDLMTLLAGRLRRATTGEVIASVLANELNMPAIYREKSNAFREFGKKGKN